MPSSTWRFSSRHTCRKNTKSAFHEVKFPSSWMMSSTRFTQLPWRPSPGSSALSMKYRLQIVSLRVFMLIEFDFLFFRVVDTSSRFTVNYCKWPSGLVVLFSWSSLSWVTSVGSILFTTSPTWSLSLLASNICPKLSSTFAASRRKAGPFIWFTWILPVAPWACSRCSPLHLTIVSFGFQCVDSTSNLDVLFTDDWKTLLGNLPKLGLSLACIFYDIIFLMQEFVFYRHSNNSKSCKKALKERNGNNLQDDHNSLEMTPSISSGDSTTETSHIVTLKAAWNSIVLFIYSFYR